MRKVAIWLGVPGGFTPACGVGRGGPPHAAPGGGGTPNAQKVDVVASTSVWAAVASAVAGDHARVKSIITSPVDDPHSFEASPADAAAISDAALVVYNGGDYDHFVDDVLAKHSTAKTVNAFTAGGHPAGANPH